MICILQGCQVEAVVEQFVDAFQFSTRALASSSPISCTFDLVIASLVMAMAAILGSSVLTVYASGSGEARIFRCNLIAEQREAISENMISTLFPTILIISPFPFKYPSQDEMHFKDISKSYQNLFIISGF